MKFDETIKKVKDTLFIIFAIVFVLAFVVIGVIYGYSFFTNKEIFKNLINFPDEVIIGLLAILLAFAGIISYLVYKVVSRDIKIEVKKVLDEERNLSRYETYLNNGYSCWSLFHEKEIENLKGELIEELKENLINRAIKFTKRSLESIAKLDQKQYEKNLCWCKNNLVYYLTERAKNYETTENDEEEAMNLGDEIYQTAKRKSAKYEKSYDWKESYAWALWWFGKEDKDNERRKKAINIVKELKQDLKTKKEKKWYKGITKKYIELIKQEQIKNSSLFKEELDKLENIMNSL